MKNTLKKITMFLISKQPEISDEILNDYLDKKVISIRVNELNDFRDGEVLKFEKVVLHNSIINGSRIESDGLIVVGSNNMISSNHFTNPPETSPVTLDLRG